MTHEEIETQMNELVRKYVETHDNEIIEELYKLECELEKMEKLDVIFKGTHPQRPPAHQ
jgi:hypothetical protein